ncbi:MAG: TIGR02266 family protein [Bacteroidota bacterium]
MLKLQLRTRSAFDAAADVGRSEGGQQSNGEREVVSQEVEQGNEGEHGRHGRGQARPDERPGPGARVDGRQRRAYHESQAARGVAQRYRQKIPTEISKEIPQEIPKENQPEDQQGGTTDGMTDSELDDGRGDGDDDQGDGDDDRRLAERAPIALKVEYKRLNTFFYDYTKNISKGGTFIKTDRPLEIGTVFLFRLQVPVSRQPIELRGEVRWVIRPGETPPPSVPAGHEPGMGIRFVYDSAADREVLERSVEKMMVNSLGQLIYSRLLGSDGD